MLDSVREKTQTRKKRKRGSRDIDIGETNRKVDITSPDSILVNFSLRHFINRKNFYSLPLFYQYKLVKLLPKCDQIETSEGWIKLDPSAFKNEFFDRASRAWEERLKEGKKTPEYMMKWKNDILKEKARLDPWKVKNFEPVWGKQLESERNAVSEIDRLPKLYRSALSNKLRDSDTKAAIRQEDEENDGEDEFIAQVRNSYPVLRCQKVSFNPNVNRGKRIGDYKKTLADEADSINSKDRPLSPISKAKHTLRQINKGLTIEPVKYDSENDKTLVDSIRTRSFHRLRPRKTKENIIRSRPSLLSSLNSSPSSSPSPFSESETLNITLPYKLPSGTTILPCCGTPNEVPVITSCSLSSNSISSSSSSSASSSASSSSVIVTRTSARLQKRLINNHQKAKESEKDCGSGDFVPENSNSCNIRFPSEITLIPLSQLPEDTSLSKTSSSSDNSSKKLAQILPKPFRDDCLPSNELHRENCNGSMENFYPSHVDDFCKNDHLLRLPPQITVIPLGQSPMAQPTPVNSTYLISTNSNIINAAHQSYSALSLTSISSPSQGLIRQNVPINSSQIPVASNCDCNLKALVICSKCCSLFHHDCIGPFQLCVTCLVR